MLFYISLGPLRVPKVLLGWISFRSLEKLNFSEGRDFDARGEKKYLIDAVLVCSANLAQTQSLYVTSV